LGEPLGVSQRTLNKRLMEGGHLESNGGPRGAMVRRSLEGQRREVLHLLRSTVFPEQAAQTDTTDQRP